MHPPFCHTVAWPGGFQTWRVGMTQKSLKKIHHRIHYHSSPLLVKVSSAGVALGFISFIGQLWKTPHNMQLNTSAFVFMCITCALSLLYWRYQSKSRPALFTAFFLLSTFSLLIAMRLMSIGQWYTTLYILTAAFLIKLLNYMVTARNDLREAKLDPNHLMHNTPYEWQLFFIRMFIGFDLVPHFTEKLFSGPGPRLEDIQAFTHLGINHALSYVIIAGLIELAGAFAIGCGFLTRLGALCLFVYLMVATIMGKHFAIGFIWASPGGGWEYPVLWSTLIVSFAFFGGSGFSLDQVLKDNFRLPRWLTRLMGSGT
jgi:putative oxidoreductase